MTRRIAIAIGCLAANLIGKGALLAQGGIGAASSPPECNAALEITSVRFLGKADKTDRFEVAWSVSPPRSSCVRILDFEVRLSITRKRGHVDTGTAKAVSGTARKATVEVPREALETAAVSYQANLTARADSSGERVIELKASGPPVLAPGAPAAPAPAPAPGDACNPVLKFEKVNFFPASNGKDVVGVFWNASSPSPCLVFRSANVTVRLTRVDGKVETKNVPANLGGAVQTASVEFPAGAAIDRHEITVRAETRLSTTAQRFDTQKTGKFPD